VVRSLAHIFFLIGFRNRLMVLIDRANAYWTYRRDARIIIRRVNCIFFLDLDINWL
jgi:hypothetical protein